MDLLVIKIKLTKGYIQQIHINFGWLKFCLQSHKFEHTSNLWGSCTPILYMTLPNVAQVGCPNHTPHTPHEHKHNQDAIIIIGNRTPIVTRKFTMAQRLKSSTNF